MNSMTIRAVILGACAVALAGCAHTVPMELSNARAAYQRSSEGPAAKLVPADLHVAKVALDKAEQSFKDNPDSFQTRDLAYVAWRKCEKVDALASIATEQGSTAKAKDDFSTKQGEIVTQTKADLSKSKADLNQSNSDLSQSKADLSESHAALMAALAKLAAVKEEPRGMVITLSGSVLFRSNESTLLPNAQTRLNQVADALLTTRERTLIVEGYTDSQGGDSFNQDLSQRRADAVRTYLVGRGYAADQIVAQGMGKGSPIADNATAEGRANNRRVEIVIQPARPAVSIQTGSAK